MTELRERYWNRVCNWFAEPWRSSECKLPPELEAKLEREDAEQRNTLAQRTWIQKIIDWFKHPAGMGNDGGINVDGTGLGF
jgi:hypothetical protein